MKFLSNVTVFLFMLSISAVSLAYKDKDIGDFVRESYVEGLPYQRAKVFGERDVPVLLSILDDVNDIEYWGNAVVTLLIIGDDGILEDVISFIERREVPDLYHSHNRAKLAALVGMGYLINHHGSVRAIRYLEAGLQMKTWEDRGMESLSGYYRNSGKLYADMSKHAALGLALSGTSSAQRILASSQAYDGLGYLDAYDKGNFVNFLLEESELISKVGLSSYYEERASSHTH